MALHRLYLDTNVYVEAIEVPNGAAEGILDVSAVGGILVVESDYLRSEVAAFFRRRYGRDVALKELEFIDHMPASRRIDSDEWKPAMALVDPLIRDRRDAPHFAAALVGDAEVLVSRNRRSIHPAMFDVMPVATPELILKGLVDETKWPTREYLRREWEAWARGSPRAPKRG
jgi:predicted nucleic acid-binding protein